MFDARSILDALVRGGNPQAGRPQSDPDLQSISDLLKPFGQGGGVPQADARNYPPEDQPYQTRPREQDYDNDPRSRPGQPHAGREAAYPPEDRLPPRGEGGTGGLEDLLRSVLGGGSNPQALGVGGGLGDLIGKLQQQGGGMGGIADILGQVLGQATSGVREGAGRVDDATGASRHARDAMGQLTGRSPDELIAQIKELIANNQMGAGAALGGLGALILGTGAGRSLAASAVKLGGLALIGGLAYKAYQNYQQGRPVLTGGAAQGQAQAFLAAPDGSGFEPGAVSNDQATLLIRAMIAAAAADGRIDAKEQQKILGSLQQGGIDGRAQQFLAAQINNPATAEELAADVGSPEEAVQVYTAARIAVDVDSAEEHAFLSELAARLGIDSGLAAHIDAAARAAR